MNALREKLITEIQHIPDSRLQEIFRGHSFFPAWIEQRTSGKVAQYSPICRRLGGHG